MHQRSSSPEVQISVSHLSGSLSALPKATTFSDLNPFQDTALYLNTTFVFNQACFNLYFIVFTVPVIPSMLEHSLHKQSPLLPSLKSSSDIHHLHPHSSSKRRSMSVSSGFQTGRSCTNPQLSLLLPSCSPSDCSLETTNKGD